MRFGRCVLTKERTGPSASRNRERAKAHRHEEGLAPGPCGGSYPWQLDVNDDLHRPSMQDKGVYRCHARSWTDGSKKAAVPKDTVPRAYLASAYLRRVRFIWSRRPKSISRCALGPNSSIMASARSRYRSALSRSPARRGLLTLVGLFVPAVDAGRGACNTPIRRLTARG
jgi:hypothetical protein